MKQREIKFRVWVKPENWDEENNIGLMTNGLPLGGWNNWYINLSEPFDEHQSLDGEFVVGKDIEIMQFTGLTDKNGIEVYEGDYLVERWVDDEDEDQEALLPVVWDHKNMQWCVDASFSKDGSYMVGMKEYFRFQDLEVNGNIFENPKNEE